MSADQVHIFDNGVKVYRTHLIPAQIRRYSKRNVHEQDEEDTFIELIDSLPQGARYIDVGAAIGYYVILAKQRRPDLDVHAVEPLPLHQEYLRENMGLNGLEPDSITLHDVGVGAQTGEGTLAESNFGSMLLREGADAREIDHRFRMLYPLRRIRVTTLDRLVLTVGAPVGLVQMDIQGGELDALKGAEEILRNRLVSKWLVGTHSAEIFDACAEIFTSNGYVLTSAVKNPENQPDGFIVAVAKA